jgi:hypothetical protein
MRFVFARNEANPLMQAAGMNHRKGKHNEIWPCLE